MMKGQVSRMYVKLRENRIRIRLILLLAVQTVCLIAGPAQAKIIQNCSLIPVCTQAEEIRTVQTGVFAKDRTQKRQRALLCHSIPAEGTAVNPLHLPDVQTPVSRRVRLND